MSDLTNSITKWVEKIKQSRESLTESTLKTYQTRLKKLLVLNEKSDPTFLKTIPAEEELKLLEESGISKSMKNNLLTIILVIGEIMKVNKNDMDKYKEVKKNGQISYMKESAKQQKNEKESENWISLKELKKIPEFWKRAFNKTNEEKKLFSLYWLVSQLYVTASYLPPERGNIYIKMKYYKKDPKNDKENYFVDGARKYFIINDFKTVKALGSQKISIPKNSKIVKALQAYRLYNNTDNFIVNPINNKPFTSPRFTEFLQKVFQRTGKKISSTMLRKIFISNYYKDDKSLKQRNKISKLMLHATKTAQTVYEKKD